MSDDRVETHVAIHEEGERKAIHFQEYWVRLRALGAAHAVVPVGADQAKPAPGVLEAIAEADVVLFPPSNPVVSIGTILAVPGIREAIADAGVPVVGLSPIVGNAPVRGMADKVLEAVGVEATAAAVAQPLRLGAAGRLAGRLRRRGRGGRGRVGRNPLPGRTADDDGCGRTAAMVREALGAGRGGTGVTGGAEVPGYRVWALRGFPRCGPADDLVKLIAAAVTGSGLPQLADGDVLLVTSKIVSKAEGRVVEATDREAAIDQETVRVVARRGTLRIVQNRQGLVMAAAGVDASNTPSGTVLLLPQDPDASARALRAGLREALGVEVGVVISDTFGRPWRPGSPMSPSGRPGYAYWTICAAARMPRQSAQRDGGGHRR